MLYLRVTEQRMSSVNAVGSDSDKFYVQGVLQVLRQQSMQHRSNPSAAGPQLPRGTPSSVALLQ